MQHNPGFLRLVEEAKSRIQEMTLDEWQARRTRGEALLLIDVREDHEWLEGHAHGAEHLGRGVLERDVERRVPDRATPIVLYCGGGFRSALVADNLQRMGYTHVWSLAGGWKAWLAAGLPTDRP